MKTRVAKKILKDIKNNIFDNVVYNSNDNTYELVSNLYLSNNYNFKRYSKLQLNNAIKLILKKWHNKHKVKSIKKLSNIVL